MNISNSLARPHVSYHSVAASLPPNGVEVMTKIDDQHGVFHEQTLIRRNGLWFVPDMSMYVYYTPTHWAYLP